MTDLTHVDEAGRAAMVDVTDKTDTDRVAVAAAFIALQPETLAAIAEGSIAKGDVTAAARIAGIMAAKKTSELIPLCHPLMLTGVKIEIAPREDGAGLTIEATAKVRGPTGVEMEALTAASVAALTIYDMVKAVDREAVIGDIRLLSKSGGKSGDFERDGEPAPAPARVPEPAKLVSRGFRRAPGAAAAAARPRNVDLGPATPRATHSRADAFRIFLREGRLQVSAWAAEAGLPVGLVYGFLHGRVSRLPKDAEEKLAKAANATIKDVFGSE
ncbi:Cyclic pyranopterin monophosphate synthase [Alphaproteobacteria bacterium SO-S41]|nr:Cyclic pyranopterin monophosphate synthase [Alphaproteobacteria bacterium SO-S41]